MSGRRRLSGSDSDRKWGKLFCRTATLGCPLQSCKDFRGQPRVAVRRYLCAPSHQAKSICSVRRRRHHYQSFEHELLDSPAVLDFRAVEVAFVVGGHVMEHVELAGRYAGPAERIQRLQRLPVEDPDSRGAPAGHVQETLRRVGRERHARGVLPLLQPPPTTRHQRSIQIWVMYLPSVVKICTRLPPRSATYTRPSFETFTPCTGGTNAKGPDLWDQSRWPGCAWLPLPLLGFCGLTRRCGRARESFIGTLPKAHHMRL